MKERDTAIIRVKKTTKELLDIFGKKNQTYDDIIRWLMNEAHISIEQKEE